ncbi:MULTISPECIES: type II toxin-antitoxin system VapC family toxin [unclassified Microbacterium]|uniref:type II toxin-antitoxin system VapC family toxin n=1 Tax=unclassified Microbacterium TaxID=2609290 RepID=UPI0034473FEF
MSAYLLDTHVVLWLATDPERVPRALRDSLVEAEALFVSAATGYEISQKVRLGRLEHGGQVLARWTALLRSLLAEELPLSGVHMRTAGEIDWEHRDPFDRMLVAQAQIDGLILVTADQRIRDFPEVTCADWA